MSKDQMLTMISTRTFAASDLRGRWPRPSRKELVEDCLELSAGQIAAKCRPAGRTCRGVLRWHDAVGHVQSSAAFTVAFEGPDTGRLVLEYLASGSHVCRCDVELVSTTLWRGGRRWWFRCPGRAVGARCGRRVGKLWLGSDQDRFLCRRCANLAYTSQRIRPTGGRSAEPRQD